MITNKLFTLLIVGTFVLSFGTAYTLYKFTRVDSREILKLDKKFGTPPSSPELFPIVHLATNEGRPFCSAFVVDANYAVTAAHCLEQNGKLKKEKYKFLTDL